MAGGKSVLAWAAVLSIAGCENADDTICISQAPHVPVIMKTQTDADQAMHECLLTWAQRLSLGPAGTNEVARAAVRACDGPISVKAQMDFAAYTKSLPQDYKLDETPEEYEKSVRQDALEEAYFRSVQFRAGNCRKPRARNPLTGDLD